MPPIVIDTQCKTAAYTPCCYLNKHFSYFVRLGARVVATQSAWRDRGAFADPDGQVVVVVNNTSDAAQPLDLNIDGQQSAAVFLPPHSFDTFTVPPPRLSRLVCVDQQNSLIPQFCPALIGLSV